MKNLKQNLKQMKMEDSSEQNKGTVRFFLNDFKTIQIKGNMRKSTCIN